MSDHFLQSRWGGAKRLEPPTAICVFQRLRRTEGWDFPDGNQDVLVQPRRLAPGVRGHNRPVRQGRLRVDFGLLGSFREGFYQSFNFLIRIS